MQKQPQIAAPQFVAVECDSEGLRLAFRELLEEGFQRAKLRRAAGDGMSEARAAEHMAALMDRRTLSPGYYRFALHIFGLDAEREAGLPLDPATLAAFEGAALRTLVIARSEHRAKHPPCGRCGVQQDNRSHPICTNCGLKFGTKGVK